MTAAKDNIELKAVEDHGGILTIRGGGARRARRVRLGHERDERLLAEGAEMTEDEACRLALEG